MKKFVFSLQSLFDYKVTIEKQQKAELQKARNALRELLKEELRLQNAYAENERSLERALRESTDITTALIEHDAYFRFLRDALKDIRQRIVEAEEYVSECQDRLMTTMKEIKTYKKLREEQYQDYMKEVQTEEEKEMGDIVSFNAVSG